MPVRGDSIDADSSRTASKSGSTQSGGMQSAGMLAPKMADGFPEKQADSNAASRSTTHEEGDNTAPEAPESVKNDGNAASRTAQIQGPSMERRPSLERRGSLSSIAAAKVDRLAALISENERKFRQAVEANGTYDQRISATCRQLRQLPQEEIHDVVRDLADKIVFLCWTEGGVCKDRQTIQEIDTKHKDLLKRHSTSHCAYLRELVALKTLVRVCDCASPENAVLESACIEVTQYEGLATLEPETRQLACEVICDKLHDAMSQVPRIAANPSFRAVQIQASAFAGKKDGDGDAELEILRQANAQLARSQSDAELLARELKDRNSQLEETVKRLEGQLYEFRRKSRVAVADRALSMMVPKEETTKEIDEDAHVDAEVQSTRERIDSSTLTDDLDIQKQEPTPDPEVPLLREKCAKLQKELEQRDIEIGRARTESEGLMALLEIERQTTEMARISLLDAQGLKEKAEAERRSAEAEAKKEKAAAERGAAAAAEREAAAAAEREAAAAAAAAVGETKVEVVKVLQDSTNSDKVKEIQQQMDQQQQQLQQAKVDFAEALQAEREKTRHQFERAEAQAKQTIGLRRSIEELQSEVSLLNKQLDASAKALAMQKVEPQREKELEAFQEFMRPPDVKSLMEAYAGVEDYKVPYRVRCRMSGKRRTEILCDDALMRQKRSTAVAVARSASFLLSLRPEQRLAWGPVREYEDIDLPSAGSVFLTQPDSYEAVAAPGKAWVRRIVPPDPCEGGMPVEVSRRVDLSELPLAVSRLAEPLVDGCAPGRPKLAAPVPISASVGKGHPGTDFAQGCNPVTRARLAHGRPPSAAQALRSSHSAGALRPTSRPQSAGALRPGSRPQSAKRELVGQDGCQSMHQICHTVNSVFSHSDVDYSATVTPLVTPLVSRPSSAGVSRPTSAGLSRPPSAGLSRPQSAQKSRPASAGMSRPTSAAKKQ